MNFSKSITICQQPVKYVRNHYGICLGHQQLTSVKGKKQQFKLTKKKTNQKTTIFPKRCRTKIHKEHVDSNDPLAPCKLHHDPHCARDMLLLATSGEDQGRWVSRLSRRIQKCGYKANSSNSDGSKISPR